MRYIFIVIIAGVCQVLMAQATFFKTYPAPQTRRIYETQQTTDGNYILVGARQMEPPFDEYEQGLIMLIDESGNYISEQIIHKGDFTSFSNIDKIPGNEGRFLLVGVTDTLVEEKSLWLSQSFFCEINTDLELLSFNYIHKKVDTTIRTWKTSFKNDSTILMQASLYDPNSTTTGPRMLATEVILPGNIKHSYMSDLGTTCIAQDILYIPHNCETHLIYFGGYTEKSLIKILRLDNNLNRITSLAPPIDLTTTPCATLITDSTYLLTGTGYDHSGGFALSVLYNIEMNMEANGLNSVGYYNHPDTILYAGAGTNTVIINDTIWVVGMYNIDPGPWQNTPTWLQLTKMDMDLNIISHTFFGGDMVYESFCIIATQDKGVLITGRVFDFTPPVEYRYDPFALKLNADGMIVGTGEEPGGITVQDAIVYPNPGSELIKVQSGPQVDGALFELFNLNGKLVLSTTLDERMETINISTVPPGTYPYRVTYQNKIVASGKWVKQ